jgi:hypothetical protein
MLNIELAIIFYILVSFLLFYYYSETDNIEGACTSKPFYFNRKSSSPGGSRLSQTSSGEVEGGTQDMISAFVLTIEEIEAAMADIKKKIPVNFNLGVVNNTDGSPEMYIDGTLPNVYLSFLMQNPPQGPKGQTGDNADPFGPTGKVGPKGIVGLDGYWGTTKNTIF